MCCRTRIPSCQSGLAEPDVLRSPLFRRVACAAACWCSGWRRWRRPRCGLLVPLLFYAAPPGDLAAGAGHRPRISARRRFRTAARVLVRRNRVSRSAGLLGVYALSQLCLIATYWCVFTLGRAIVGATQAAMAVLLMVGISVFTVPTPDFGPSILAMALWAAALLFYWRAVIGTAAADLGTRSAARRRCLLITSDGALDPAWRAGLVHRVDRARARRPRARRSRGSCWSD